jgi:hypothetical protein
MNIQYIHRLGTVKVLRTPKALRDGAQVRTIASLAVTDCQGDAAHILSGSVGTVTHIYANGDADMTLASACSYHVKADELWAHTRPFAEN